MDKARTILITGASGFIGFWLSEAAAAEGYDLIGVDLRAPLNPARWRLFQTGSCESIDWSAIFAERQIEAVFHLAGGASVAASVADPYGDFSSILPGTARLASQVAKHSSARFFLFSSAAVYGNPQGLPISESMAVRPISPYGVHKALAEELLGHYARILGLPVTVFRIFSVYGPGLRKQLIWDICQKVKTAETDGKGSIQLWGTGKESRDFIHVRDTCRAALLALQAPSSERTSILNVASGVENTVADVAGMLLDALRTNVRIEFNGHAVAGDPINWRADVTRLSSAGFAPQIKISDGLADFAHWFRTL